MAERHWQAGDGDGDVTNVNNWLEAAVPVTGDNVTVDNTSHSMTVNLNGLAAVTAAKLIIGPGFTGEIGTAAAYLEIGATIVDVGDDQAFGQSSYSPRIKLNFGSVLAAVTVHNTSRSSSDSPLPPVQLLGTHASNTLANRGGAVGVAVVEGEVSTFTTIDVGTTAATVRPQTTIGAGVTLASVSVVAGECVCRCAASVVVVRGGTLRTERTGAVAVANVYGGSFMSNSSGTITTLNALGGVVDFLQAGTARTVTALNLSAGAAVALDPSVVTLTNEINPAERCRISCAAA